MADTETETEEILMTPDELSKSLGKSKIQLMQTESSAFLTTILFSLKFHWDTQMKDPGIEVNGTTLNVHPNYWYNLSDPQRLTALAHEAWHVAFNHVVNVHMPGIKKDKYQEAADHVVNNLLNDANYEMLPETDLNTDYKNMSTIQVYTQLVEKDQNKDNSDQNKNNSGTNNDLAPPQGGTGKDSLQKTQEAVNNALNKAHTISKLSNKSLGNLPGEIQIALDKLFNPKLDPRTIFRNYMTSFAKDDYSYKRPNRRFLPDFYLPSLYSEGLGHVGFAIDTSASVSDDDFKAFLTEANSIREVLKPKLTTIVDFDTSIKHVHKINSEKPIMKLPFSGRGGTNLNCVFEHFNNNKNTPDVLVVFSDLYCNEITEDPGYPVVWICIDNPDANVHFGKLIHYSSN